VSWERINSSAPGRRKKTVALSPGGRPLRQKEGGGNGRSLQAALGGADPRNRQTESVAKQKEGQYKKVNSLHLEDVFGNKMRKGTSVRFSKTWGEGVKKKRIADHVGVSDKTGGASLVG